MKVLKKEQKVLEDWEVKENEFLEKLISEYKSWAGIKGDEVINESNLDDYALNHVSCKYNYDKNDLVDKLLGRGN